MKDLLTRVVIFLVFFISLNGIKAYGQQHTVNANNALNTTHNYSRFSPLQKEVSVEAIFANPGYEQHPELGVLYPEAPCKDCYELIGNRTERSKIFIKTGTGGKDVMQQTASGSLHYKGPNGEWLTIKSRLQPDNAHHGIYAAREQDAPVEINTDDKFSSLGKDGRSIQFNRNLELVFIKPGGVEEILGAADYSHYTAGDDGVYITNAWEGIDIEMLVVRGAIKTNFIVNHAMAAYAGGSLAVRDHMQFSDGLFLYVPDENKQVHMGSLEVKKANGGNVYLISAAVAFEKAAGRSTLRMLEYHIAGNDVDIVLPGNFLNRAASAYPVIIDPLVSSATTSPVSGSKYSPSWSTGCVYSNAATVPGKITVTDVQFTFQYVASGGALTNNGAYDFKLGTCRSPAPASLFWNCSSGLPGTCDAIGATIFAGQIAPCIPAPQCTQYDLNLTMDFYQNYASSSGCSPSYIAAGTPLTITVFGHTVEAGAITAVPSSICVGQSSVLTTTSMYGVAPYSFSWMPGGASGASYTVSPTSTTTYTVTITDGCGNTSSATKTINVNPSPSLGGTTTICAGGSSALVGIPLGGTWTSSNTSIATVGSSSGLVSGLGLGTANITYTTTAGCTASTPVNVIVPVAPIIGYTVVCAGSTSTLSNATAGGVWSSSVPAIGIVGSASGIATGVSAGTATISYTTSGAGCYALAILTVNPLAAIGGTTNICVGGTTTLTNSVAGGTWASSNVSIATVGSSSGVVNGISAGTATITYTTPAGCKATASVVVNLLSPITGMPYVCQGNTTTLSDAASGGVWSSSNPSMATVGSSSGVVSGISASTLTITYTIPAGCYTTTAFTVNPISPIAGTTSVCVGGTTLLSDAAGTGAWATTNPSIATVGAASGVVTGVAVGITGVTYTSAAGCVATTSVNVGLPTPIIGMTSICQGNSTILNNSTPGGIWTSANTSIAIIDATSGLMTGMSGGIVVISYTTPSGCSVMANVTINPTPPIVGTLMLCVGSTTVFTNAVGSGTWSSASTGVATIDATSGLVTAISTGTSTITYTTPATCISTITLTVNVPAPITGVPSACQGNMTLLSNATPGGTWSSSNVAIATIGSSTGVVTGVTGGTVTINYVTAGGCNAATIVTINPIAPIAGTAALCAGNTTTLTDATPGGAWSSVTPSVAAIGSLSGVVTGTVAGTTNVQYTTPAGCTAAITVTVHAAPSAIGGGTLVCTTTTLTNTVGGGIWSSSNPSVAVIVPSSGLVTGLGPGTVTITYTLSGGCFVTTIVTVDPLASISGVVSVCQGNTTPLTYPQPGGTWTSLNPSIATVDAISGVVTGVSAGIATIKYTTSTGCAASTNVTVYPILPISGIPVVCQGNTTSLSDAVPGGSWSSSASSVAAVGATGVVSGMTAGMATISYTTGAGCLATQDVTVNPLSPIAGLAFICAGGTTTLTDATPGGTWSSTTTGIATVGSTGFVSGIAAGIATIKYTTTLGCVANKIVTVNPLPSAIGGIPKVCVGSTTILSNTLPGGIWTSGTTGIATVSAGTGIVYGVIPGTAAITYTSVAGCTSMIEVTVNALPSAIIGITSICQGQTSLLTNATPGGTWSSAAPTIASIGATSGFVNGLAPGISNIKYTTAEGCYTLVPFTVNSVPTAITGIAVVCEGATTTLFNTLAGGTWSSDNMAIAGIGYTTGIVTGVSAGTTLVTYITGAGCYVTTMVTVNPTPVLSGFTFTNPTTCVNADGTITLNGLHAGESYTVNYTAGTIPVTATMVADGSGNITITGLAAGSYSNFSVVTTLGCHSNVLAGPVVLTLPPAPPAPVASNNAPICEGSPLNLTATNIVAGVTYSWIGPGGFTSTLQNPVVNPSVPGNTGTYTVTATKLGCVSAPGTTNVVIHPIPHLTNIIGKDPTTCEGTDGTVTLSGLVAGVSYSVNYTFNGDPASATVIADGSGNVAITGLSKGVYAGFNVSSFTCLSNSLGPVSLRDPNPPPKPKLYGNSPLCSGKTLLLDATDMVTNLIYEWSGPNGFSSNLRNPEIPNVSMADSGLYTLIIRHLNCPSYATENIIVYPPLVLTYVTPDQVIPLGSSITLKAVGAVIYYWSPNDGTLNNNNIDSPVATPVQTTVYSIHAMNIWGCEDTAQITITVDDNINTGVPNAFTPNGDGNNDVFKPEHVKYDKLVEFSVFNRWGQLVYRNIHDLSEGWDGTFNGVPQDMGVYNYNITLNQPNGKLKNIKGTVALIR